MNKQKLKITGVFRLVLRDHLGEVILSFIQKNDIVDTGLAFLASRAVGAADPVMSHIAIGSGATAVVPADVALDNELAREALSSVAAVANDVTYEASFGPGIGTGAITESGILNAGVAGTLLNRLVFPVINKGALDTVEVTWIVTFEDDGV